MATGRKTGGRQKGTPNRATSMRERVLARGGLMPLDYMLSILRDENADAGRRDEMAKAAAPYCHPKLTSIDARLHAELSGKVEHDLLIDSRRLTPDQRAALRELLAAAVNDDADEEAQAAI